MTFKELLKTVVFNDVWTELEKEYCMKDEAYKIVFCGYMGTVLVYINLDLEM